MQSIIDSITQWLTELLVGGITDNLSGMFDNVNQKVGEIAGEVGMTPSVWNGGVFSMIRKPLRNSDYSYCRHYLDLYHVLRTDTNGHRKE